TATGPPTTKFAIVVRSWVYIAETSPVLDGENEASGAQRSDLRAELPQVQPQPNRSPITLDRGCSEIEWMAATRPPSTAMSEATELAGRATGNSSTG
ncbi:hypothetical protein ACIQU6_39520, partial [Streptomyces sp. NPDC090442]|uniref:hypothetical protein n=1 Tax=Streptomyces sp. NPDC090442 TaxID=3365962 RepID=UPI0037F358F0